jgi:regulator of nonsense transcripts 2
LWLRFLAFSTIANLQGFRKRLVDELAAVPRQRLDLLPQYARIAAALSTVAFDPKASVSAQLSAQLKLEFRSLLRRKATASLRRDLHDVRLKNARFIAELTKFGHRFGAPPLLALSAVKACCEDFSGANVDVACALLEGCGRYLLNTKATKAKTEKLLAAILRLKNAKNLDPGRRALVENAFYACRPPQALQRGVRAAAKAKRLAETPLEERYARHLLLERLHPPAAAK